MSVLPNTSVFVSSGSSSVSRLATNITCGGDNRMLVVYFLSRTNWTFSNTLFDGQSMSLLIQNTPASQHHRLSVYWVSNPTNASAEIDISSGSTATLCALGAVSYSGVLTNGITSADFFTAAAANLSQSNDTSPGGGNVSLTDASLVFSVCGLRLNQLPSVGAGGWTLIGQTNTTDATASNNVSLSVAWRAGSDGSQSYNFQWSNWTGGADILVYGRGLFDPTNSTVDWEGMS